MNNIQEEMKYLATEAFEPTMKEWMPAAAEAINKCLEENENNEFLSVAEAKALRQSFRYFNVRNKKKEVNDED